MSTGNAGFETPPRTPSPALCMEHGRAPLGDIELNTAFGSPEQRKKPINDTGNPSSRGQLLAEMEAGTFDNKDHSWPKDMVPDTNTLKARRLERQARHKQATRPPCPKEEREKRRLLHKLENTPLQEPLQPGVYDLGTVLAHADGIGPVGNLLATLSSSEVLRAYLFEHAKFVVGTKLIRCEDWLHALCQRWRGFDRVVYVCLPLKAPAKIVRNLERHGIPVKGLTIAGESYQRLILKNRHIYSGTTSDGAASFRVGAFTPTRRPEQQQATDPVDTSAIRQLAFARR